MQEGTLQRTPDRPGRARRTHLEVASPFSLFAKELPPITPPRPSWANPSVAWTGQPGLSPALAGFTTPGLSIEASESSGRSPMRGSRNGGEGIAKPARRSASAAAVLMQSPEDGSQAKQQNRAVRGTLGRLSSKEAASPKGVTIIGREKQDETKQGPSPSRAASLATPGVGCPDTSILAWEAACTLDTVKGGLSFLPPCEIESTIPIPPASQQLSMVDRWQSGKSNAAAYTQPATNGWERRLEAAGNLQTWHRSDNPDSGSVKSPQSTVTQEGPQEMLPMFAAEKGRPAQGCRPDRQRLMPANAAAVQPAGTPAPRRLSTSSGSRASVIPPDTPGDDILMTVNQGPTSEPSELPKKCNCKKSRCLKLYCDCFAAGQYCKHSCSCQSCMNTADNRDLVVNMREQVRQRNPQAFQQKIEKQVMGQGLHTGGLHKRGCHCKKSHCKKKYCECFQAGVNCGVHCKCEDCHNTQEDGLPPPPRVPKAGNTNVSKMGPHTSSTGQQNSVAYPALTIQPLKTSPGTPPAMTEEVVTKDSRRGPERNFKRKATWQLERHEGDFVQQISKQAAVANGPSTQNPGILSPPDMVWPAHNLAQGPAHVLEGSQSNNQTAKGKSKEAVYQQRGSWLDRSAAQKPNSLSVCAPDHAPNQPDHLHAGAVAQGDCPGKACMLPIGPTQGPQSESLPSLDLSSGLKQARRSHTEIHKSQILLQLLTQYSGEGPSQLRSASHGQLSLDAPSKRTAVASHPGKPSTAWRHNMKATGVPIRSPLTVQAEEARISLHPSTSWGNCILTSHGSASGVAVDIASQAPDMPFNGHPTEEQNGLHDGSCTSGQEMPGKIRLAHGECLAGERAGSVTQDMSNQGFELSSPERMPAGGQMRMKRVVAGRTVISPNPGCTTRKTV